MLAGVDHVVIAVRDLAPAVRAYETLLGHEATTRDERDGVERALIATGDVAVELMAPAGESEGAARLEAALQSGEGLKSLVFAVADVERAHRRAARVGLAPGPVQAGAHTSWRAFRLDTQKTHGVRIFCIERRAPLAPASAAADAVLGLDHVVVRSADVERAAALYGARLGLDMRLDRVVANRRLMFFRCAGTVVEIAEADGQGAQDALWGLSWRVADAAAARARLRAAGVDVSEVRDGMKPGTRVFSVRDGTCGTPTLMIEQGSRFD